MSADARAVGNPTRRRGFVRRHPVLLAAFLLLTAVVAGGFAFAIYINTLVGDIDRFDTETLPDARRPAKIDSDAVNILLAGVDKGDGRSIAEIQDGGWDAGVLRSDTIMVLHLTADRERAYLISIPRDSYVRLYDAIGRPQQMDKINAAFSLFGPAAYLSTVENLTDLRMDHLAVVDWTASRASPMRWVGSGSPLRARGRSCSTVRSRSGTSAPATGCPAATSTASTGSRISCAPS